MKSGKGGWAGLEEAGLAVKGRFWAQKLIDVCSGLPYVVQTTAEGCKSAKMDLRTSAAVCHMSYKPLQRVHICKKKSDRRLQRFAYLQKWM